MVSDAKKVLIIEDDEMFLNNLTELMVINGYLTQTAADGREGLLKIAAFQPDLVICDIDLPVLNGYEVLQHLRSQRGYTAAFIFLSARIPVADEERRMSALANAHIIKPISFVLLLKRVKTILS